MMHRLLARQLRKAGIDPEADSAVPAAALRALLAGVDASYEQADQYRYLQEQALSVSSREMADLAARVESDRREQEALRDVATAVAEGRPDEEIFAVAAERAGRLLNGCAARVYRVEGDPSQIAYPVGAWSAPGTPEELTRPKPVRLASTPGAQLLLLSESTTLLSVDDSAIAPCAAGVSKLDLTALMGSPIRVDGEHWGALVVMSLHEGGDFEGRDRALERFASLVSMAIANAEAHARLRDLASIDHLTGLASRHVFQDALSRETGVALEHGGHLSLALMDFDDFKMVNDQLGHHVGDRVLAGIARALQEQSPEDATLARLGGDEFAWLMPGLNAAGATAVVERAQQQLRALDLGSGVGQTLSAGVCDLARAQGEPAELYRMADGALYAAKRSRRGSCMIYAPEMETPASAEERRKQLERSRGLQAVRALARAVDARDPQTHSHSERVAALSAALAENAGWAPGERERLYEAALVHDVGKIGVPDALLRYPGRLDEEQMAIIRTHAAMGAEIAAGLLDDDQVSWVRHHHERWDGAGYPDRLPGIYVPEGARIMSVADSFDAMVSDRPYRAGLTVAEAVNEIRVQAGRQFDPELARAFVAMWRAGHELIVGPCAQDPAHEPLASRPRS